MAVDGSKLKAVNNRDKNFTKAKMDKRLAGIEKRIARYLAELDEADRWEQEQIEAHQRRIAQMQAEQERLKGLEKRMLEMPDQQLSLTDPDARSMKSRGQGIVGYNVQIAVESQYHLIVAHEVNNVGSDRGQLNPMANQAREAIGSETLTVVADRGYYSGEQIQTCEEDGIEAAFLHAREIDPAASPAHIVTLPDVKARS